MHKISLTQSNSGQWKNNLKMDVVAKLKPTVVGEDRILRSHEKCEIPPITLVSLFAAV